MQYLADWQMTLARDLLLAQDVTIDEITAHTRYSSCKHSQQNSQAPPKAPRRWQQRDLAAAPADEPHI